MDIIRLLASAGALESGLVGFPLGLVVGSFCTVVYHRWVRGESIVFPRSHCPSCSHVLRPRDLIPVVSYVLAHGRCRYCGVAVSSRYPVIELSSGLLAGLSCALVGLPLGLVALIVPIPISAGLASHHRRSTFLRQADEKGFTLIEVLVGLLLLSLTVVSVMESIRASNRGAVVAQRHTVAVNLAREGLARAAASARELAPGDTLGAENWTSGDYRVTYTSTPGATANTWRVVVSVTCSQCSSGAFAGSGTTLSGVVRR